MNAVLFLVVPVAPLEKLVLGALLNDDPVQCLVHTGQSGQLRREQAVANSVDDLDRDMAQTAKGIAVDIRVVEVTALECEPVIKNGVGLIKCFEE